jgi:hypothetical protein
MASSKEAVKAKEPARSVLTVEQARAKVASAAIKRVRTGKTRRDRENGAANKNAQNRDSRASWQNGRDTSGGNKTSFPYASCNGKRNRFQVTGKDGSTVFLRDSKSSR